MSRRYIVWISLVSLTAGVVLNTSLQTRQQQDRLTEINQQIKDEQERIRVLTAEWYSLKAPDRLEALAQRHLQGYGAIKPLQLAGLDTVPERLPDAVTPAQTSNVAAATPAAPAAVTAAKPAAAQVASITPPRPRPATRPAVVAAAKPALPAAAKPSATRQDDVAALIERHSQPANPASRTVARADADGIRTIIERQRPQNGVQWASLGDE